ncbi:hypothetical protein [Neobacillus vireti]|uniref:hypothetical protein n=1 Tax=Neobacillus vireti TaxID=220686 RepID=UPI002FFE18A1
MLSIPAIMLIYPYLNTPTRGVHTLVTSLDKAIPVVKWFVIPYVAWVGYLTITLIYFCFKDPALAFKTILYKMVELVNRWVLLPKRTLKHVTENTLSI